MEEEQQENVEHQEEAQVVKKDEKLEESNWV